MHEEKFGIHSKAEENIWICWVIWTLSLFLHLFRHIQPDHWCSLWRKAVRKLPPSLQKHRSLAETLCAGKPVSTFLACVYCFHTSLLPFDHYLLYQHRTKDSVILLLHLWVTPKGKREGKPGAALCVHILSPPSCPFPLSGIKGQLYSYSTPQH